MWKEKILELNNDNSFSIINEAATEEEISKLNKALKLMIPTELEDLLKEINGDDTTFLSVNQIIEDNLSLRKLECFMPLDCLLFFAENGCGDYFGFAIRKNGEIDNNIFMWDHESDSRNWVASDLNHFIERRKNDEV